MITGGRFPECDAGEAKEADEDGWSVQAVTIQSAATAKAVTVQDVASFSSLRRTGKDHLSATARIEEGTL
ncbi:MAG: hypothetical protein NZM29_02105 [Nitrospira sp.]|nr:hypothetical protein [Nitrospira sp.]